MSVCPPASALHFGSNVRRHRNPVDFCPSAQKSALVVVCRGETLPDYGSSAKEFPNKLIRAFWSAPQHPSLISELSSLLRVSERTHGGAYRCVHNLPSDPLCDSQGSELCCEGKCKLFLLQSRVCNNPAFTLVLFSLKESSARYF